ncbi:MAG: hypothetical protein II777_00880 [Clostridia bacterium]|nr:hypothetical protein [Clostridia bacterium]
MNKYKLKRIISTAFLAVLVAVTAFLSYASSDTVLPTKIDENTMRAVFFDVGNNDCAAFYTKDACILIGAPRGECEKTAGYLKRSGFENIDYYIIPDYNDDHCKDARVITDAFTVKNLLLPIPYDSAYTNYNTLKSLNKQKSNVVDVYRGMTFETGGMTLEVLSPENVPYSSKDGGIVVKISYEDKAVLWCADINVLQEEKIINASPERLSCDVIKLPLHGSKTANSDELLEFSFARYAVISCGRNSYGHPSVEVLERLEKRKIETFITQSNGAVIFDITRNGIEKIR